MTSEDILAVFEDDAFALSLARVCAYKYVQHFSLVVQYALHAWTSCLIMLDDNIKNR